MANDMRDRLVELIKQAEKCPPEYDGEPRDEASIFHCAGCEYEESTDCLAERIADHLIANNVGFFPTVNMENKCGSCIYAKPVVAFGASRCYVNCTNKEHIERFCHREISTLRQRTHPACKSYKAKFEAEQKLKEMRGEDK